MRFFSHKTSSIPNFLVFLVFLIIIHGQLSSRFYLRAERLRHPVFLSRVILGNLRDIFFRRPNVREVEEKTRPTRKQKKTDCDWKVKVTDVFSNYYRSRRSMTQQLSVVRYLVCFVNKTKSIPTLIKHGITLATRFFLLLTVVT